MKISSNTRTWHCLVFCSLLCLFLVMFHYVKLKICSFVFSSSSFPGFGRHIWGVHFLTPSGQPPQLLLRPAGQTLNSTIILGLLFCYVSVSLTSHYSHLCPTTRPYWSRAQEILWVRIPTSAWSRSMTMRRWVKANRHSHHLLVLTEAAVRFVAVIYSSLPSEGCKQLLQEVIAQSLTLNRQRRQQYSDYLRLPPVLLV